MRGAASITSPAETAPRDDPMGSRAQTAAQATQGSHAPPGCNHSGNTTNVPTGVHPSPVRRGWRQTVWASGCASRGQKELRKLLANNIDADELNGIRNSSLFQPTTASSGALPAARDPDQEPAAVFVAFSTLLQGTVGEPPADPLRYGLPLRTMRHRQGKATMAVSFQGVPVPKDIRTWYTALRYNPLAKGEQHD